MTRRSYHGIDLITNLPDWAISRILSSLPTVDAVRTSVLSKYWEYKWTLSYNFEIDDLTKFNKSESRKVVFANFVDRILLLSQNLQSFSLTCVETYDLIRMKTWISAALSRNVHNLYISYCSASIEVLPCNLLTCYSLRELYLFISGSTLKVSANICFPYLTTLSLVNIQILNELCNSNVLKFNLPVLETFVILSCKWLNVKFVEIYAPKMTRFLCTSHKHDCSFIITGGSRLRLITHGCLAENIILSGGSQVVFAHLTGCDFEEDIYHLKKRGLEIRKLMIRSFLSLEELYLSAYMAEVIALSKPRLSLPKYYKMERITMCCGDNAEVLLELLHAMPFLKYVRIHEKDGTNNYDYDAEEHVPSCIVSHLEEVVLAYPGELKLTKFILKNAVKLKSVRVSCKKIAEELSAYPKTSTCVAIVRT